MIKRFFLMMMMAGVITSFVACSDSDDSGNGPEAPLNPVEGCTITPTTVKAGESVTLKSGGFDKATAKLTLVGATATIQLDDVTFTSTGATFKVPFATEAGTYKLMLKQNGDWEVGTLNVQKADLPITGLIMPTDVNVGQELLLEGAGFNATSKLYAVKAATTKTVPEGAIELPVLGYTNGLKCTVPDNMENGEYNLWLKQDGVDWQLEGVVNFVIFEVKSKRLVGLTNAFKMGDEGLMGMEMSVENHWEIKYDQDELLEVAFTTKQYMTGQDEGEGSSLWVVSKTSNGYDFILSEDQVGEQSFKVDVKDGRATDIFMDGDLAGSWTYASNGNLEGISVGGEIAIDFPYENGNFIASESAPAQYDYAESNLLRPAGCPDLALLEHLTNYNNSMQGFAIIPALLGLTGEASVNLPTSAIVYDIDWEIMDYVAKKYDITLEKDAEGYITSLKYEFESEGTPASVILTLSYE